ncbi:MAG: lysophospholipase [Lachnospiraceae bacterium]|nr:lysophospholipase [Lachnospiraceae bacterium]
MKEFFIEDDRIHLHAKLDMPEGKDKCPLVLLIHGFTGDMEEPHIIGVKDAILDAGCASFRVEMYGHGKSEGAFREHTLFKWISNVMRATEYARSLPFVTDLYICGHSQGGLLVILAAGMRPDAYKGLIPLSPALSIPEDARKGSLLGQPFDPEHIPDEVEIWDHKLSGNYFRCAQLIHVEDAISRCKKPVLFIHGDADEAVPVRCSIEAARQYPDSRLLLLPGDDHCYGHHLDLAKKVLTEFLKDTEAVK